MKHTPLFFRIIGGILIAALLAVGCILPLNTRGEAAALIGLSKRGLPYVFGSLGPDSYDCSGLTKHAFECLDVELIHSAQFVAYDDQYMTIESADDLIPGDLIFFDTIRDKDKCDHVGIWLGGNRFVHASSSEMVVMISEYDDYWQQHYSWSKRIVSPYPIEISLPLSEAEAT